MDKTIGVYFSGTGNSKHCIEFFLKELDVNAKAYSIEDASVVKSIEESDTVILAYPIYFSNLPKMLRDFLIANKTAFANKKVFIIATMGLFSGDGSGCSSRLLVKYGAKILGGLHLKMPDCIADEKVLKKTIEKNRETIINAEAKLKIAANRLKENKSTREGLGFFYRLAGLLGQRLWFYNKTKKYSNKLKINAEKCIGCGLCAKICPMKNLSVDSSVALPKGECTMCYRCVNKCPKQAITLLGKTVHEQYKIENIYKS